MTASTQVLHIDRVDLAFEDKPWPFAQDHRAEIDLLFADLQRRKPAVWNGQVLLMHDYALASGVLRGKFLQTDYASFTAWRSWDAPDRTVFDCFAPAAIRSSDGAFILGVMAEHTANAGQIYFPAGTPDLSDRSGGGVDLERGMARELKEETGLDAGEFDAAPGWTLLRRDAVVAVVKTLQSQQTADAVRERILRYLDAQRQPELSGIQIVRGPHDLDPAILDFIQAFLRAQWQ